MTACLKMNYLATNCATIDGGESLSASLCDDSSVDSAFANDHFMCIKKEDSMSPCRFRSSGKAGSVSNSDMSPSSPEFSKVDIRRLKNRESAARSRQKIKNKLNSLEKSVNRLEEKKEAVINEKFLIINEIESLENQMISLSLEKIKGSLSPMLDIDPKEFSV